ncbi:E3 ubiquitin-protein ligase TRAIP [Musca vetustissima]|uniref:E3 ubiquitin-protein ligase TRAIP n=1 Tax=Musca vetustissima TaxID=27455 RepID=UPI002AB69E20|nr:E3 ubiquitin-protein ligase TRAIP [Musca vetustissima]
MAGLYLMCPICTEDFQMQDTVYSTDCGHLYHFSCMQQWRSRSSCCPQCRHHDPSTHRIFLIGNSQPIPTAPKENVDDLKTQLESSIDKIHELQAQLEEAELNLFHMQEQFTVEQGLKKSLERTLAEYKNNEDNFLNLHGQYSESEERVQLLLEENERLTLENNYKANEIKSKMDEITKLKETFNKDLQFGDIQNECKNDQLTFLEQEIERLTKELEQKNREITEQKVKQKMEKAVSSDIVVKSLQQRLQHTTEQLEKEITNSITLECDKMKLQSKIQRLEEQQQQRINNNETPDRKPKTRRERKNKTDATNNNTSHILPNTKNVNNSSTVPPTVNENDSPSGVVLQKFPYKEIRYPLEDMIVSFAAKMNTTLTKDDIVRVNILDKLVTNKIPTTVCMHVVLRTNILKQNFISQQFLLRNYEIFRDVFIKEYVDREIHGLFLYAKRQLRGTVFESIVIQNNEIIGKKKFHDASGTIIKSKEQVDELRNKSVSQPIIDEYYYKISV